MSASRRAGLHGEAHLAHGEDDRELEQHEHRAERRLAGHGDHQRQHAEGEDDAVDHGDNARALAAEVGEETGVTPCFEVHVNMWSEHFGRIQKVAEAVEREGPPAEGRAIGRIVGSWDRATLTACRSSAGEATRAVPSLDDLLEWLRYVQHRCPECEGEAR